MMLAVLLPLLVLVLAVIVAGAMSPHHRRHFAARHHRRTFEDVTTDTLTMGAPSSGQTFEVDAEARTIYGLAVPYGEPTHSDGARFQFARGVIQLPEDVSRVKLLISHERGTAVGYATELTDSDEGLWARFSVARGARGDEALSLAQDRVLDGLSVGIRDGAKFAKRGGVTHFSRAVLAEISLTSDPAFSSARVAAVTAETPTPKGTTNMECEHCHTVHAPGVTECATPAAPAAFDMAAFAAALAQHMPGPAAGTVNPANPTGFEAAESPYVFDAQRGHFGLGGEHDFSGDIIAGLRGDVEAYERAMTFVQQQFAVITGNVSPNNPAGQRPDMYVRPRDYRFPLWDAVRKGGLSDVTPFVFPKFNSAAGLVSDHTEGVEPTDGTFTTTSQTVTPKAMSGKVQITREVWDQGGNPQVSNLIWAKMVQSWNEALEAAVVTELNAQAASITGVTLTTAQVNGALVAELQGFIADLQYVRGGFAFDTFAVQTDLYRKLATAIDTTGQPILPAYGDVVNRDGRASQLYRSLNIAGIEAVPAWALAASSSNAALSWLFDSLSVHSWASVPQRLEFQYRVAYVDLAIWGYRAVAISDLTGVRKISYDPVA